MGNVRDDLESDAQRHAEVALRPVDRPHQVGGARHVLEAAEQRVPPLGLARQPLGMAHARIRDRRRREQRAATRRVVVP